MHRSRAIYLVSCAAKEHKMLRWRGAQTSEKKKTGNACMVPICDLTCPSLLQLVNASAPPGWHIHKSGGGGPIWQRRHVTYAGLGWKAGEGNSVKLGPFVRSYLYLWSSPLFLSIVRRYSHDRITSGFFETGDGTSEAVLGTHRRRM
jgi:hypothetical protein